MCFICYFCVKKLTFLFYKPTEFEINYNQINEAELAEIDATYKKLAGSYNWPVNSGTPPMTWDKETVQTLMRMMFADGFHSCDESVLFKNNTDGYNVFR